MQRKVALIGPSTLMISLPSKWAKKHAIKKGDELEIKDNGKSLVISVDKVKNVEKTSVDVSGLNERIIKWILSALHKSGYDEIEIKYSDKKELKTIQDMIKNVLMGFAIMDQNDKRVIMRCVAQDVPSELDAALRRAFLVTISLAENSLDLIKNKKFDELQGLINLEQTNNQLTNFCERILNKHGVENDRTRSFWYVIAWNLEKLCDEYKYICQMKFNKEVNKEVLQFYTEVNSLLKEYYSLFYNFNISKIKELESKADSLEEKGKKLTNKESELVYYLLNIISNIKDFFASTIALNKVCESTP